LVGEMESALQQARVMHRSMVATAITGEPGPETTNSIMIARTLVGRAAIATVEKALEVAGGAGFYREAGLDRLFRDVQAARFHPLQEKVQLRYSGRCALGLNLDE
jgi:acyl-CoA dehydrogenase